jgi:hypothetical protein
MEHTTIAVDLAKSVFQVAVSHRAGSVDRERRLTKAYKQRAAHRARLKMKAV